MVPPPQLPDADIAKVSHWDSVWKRSRTVPRVSPVNYHHHRWRELFASIVARGDRVVELGCGGSRWVSYLARTFDCESWGIDYSPEGLRLTEAVCRVEGVQCCLVFGDVFDDRLLPESYFDVVYSMGFAEHFTDPSLVTRRIARLLRPGGVALTTVPNFTGIYGKLQRHVDPEVFAKHVVLVAQQLDEAHEAASLRPRKRAHFFGCFGPGVVNYVALERRGWGLGRMILPAVQVLQQTVCWGLRTLHADLESHRFSPYIAGIYEKS